jgi:hypothetical protein
MGWHDRIGLRVGMAAMALLLAANTALAEPSVVAAYSGLRASGAAPDLAYDVREAPGGFATISPDWGNAIPVEVDAANGWMRIADEGTGGGSFEAQVVLWRLDHGAGLLGIAESVFDPPHPGASRVRFFSDDYGRWGEWTEYTWPKVTLADFLPGDMTIDDLRALEDLRSVVHVTLPREGRDALARLVTRDEEIAAVCGGEDWFVPADPAAYLRYCARIAPRLAREIVLHFDGELGRFTKGTAR